MNPEKKFFFNACQQVFREPLYKYCPDGISVLLCASDFEALRDYLTVVASCSQLLNQANPPRFILCTPEAEAFKGWLLEKCPMLREDGGLPPDMGRLEFVCKPPEEFIPYIFAEEGFDLPGKTQNGAHIERIFPVSEVDEELERLTLNCNYVYAAGRALPMSWKDMTRSLKEDYYSYSSSMLQAAHVPCKLHCCGIEADDLVQAAQAYEEKRLSDSSIARKMLYLEHHRWMVFMALSGWRLPSEAELRRYAFVLPEESEDHKMIRDFKHKEAPKLHPSLVPCGTSPLMTRDKAFWDNYREDAPEYSHLDPLDHSSLKLHSIVSELAERHLRMARELLDQEAGSSEAQAVERLRAALSHLESRQQHAQSAFLAELDSARSHLSSALLNRLSELTASALERNEYRDYKQGDASAAEHFGAILLFREHCDRLIRMLSERQEDNAAAMLALDPSLICFIIPPEMNERTLERIQRSLKECASRRQMRVEFRFDRCADFTEQAWADVIRRVREREGELAADLTGTSAGFVLATADMPAIIAHGGVVKNFRRCEGVEAFNQIKRRLTVEQMFALADRYALKGWKVGSWDQIEKALPKLFETYLKMTEPDENSKDGCDNVWTTFTEYAAKHMQFHKLGERNYVEWRVNASGNQRSMKYTFTITGEQASARRVSAVLNQLNAAKVIEKLQFEDVKNGVRYEFYSVFPNVASTITLSDKDDPFIVEFLQPGVVRLRQQATYFEIPQNIDADAGSRVEKAVSSLSKAGLLRKIDKGQNCYECINGGVRNVFLVTGAVLEDYLYWCVKTCGAYSDVQLGWEFAMDRNIDYGHNEIDVVAMVGKQPVFFSCKVGKNIGLKDIDEVSTLANRYGINNPKAVFVVSCSEPTLRKLQMHTEGSLRMAGEEYMGVHFIDRSILSDHEALLSKLRAIAGPVK